PAPTVNMVEHSTARRRDFGSRSLDLKLRRCLPPTPPSSGGRGDLLQEVKFIENPPDPQGHAGYRILGDRHGKLGFLPEQPVQPAEEATTAGDDDARIDDIRG